MDSCNDLLRWIQHPSPLLSFLVSRCSTAVFLKFFSRRGNTTQRYVFLVVGLCFLVGFELHEGSLKFENHSSEGPSFCNPDFNQLIIPWLEPEQPLD